MSQSYMWYNYKVSIYKCLYIISYMSTIVIYVVYLLVVAGISCQGNALNQLPVGGGSAQDERALRLSLLTRQQNESRRLRR